MLRCEDLGRVEYQRSILPFQSEWFGIKHDKMPSTKQTEGNYEINRDEIQEL